MANRSELPSPKQVKGELPLLATEREFIELARSKAMAIVQGEEDTRVAIVGPCSIHDPQSAIEYASRLAHLSSHLSGFLFPIMRFFVEKPRSRLGWKGLLYDPFLDESNEIGEGIRLSRKLLRQLAQMKIPCAAEFVDPLLAPYFDDLLVWGVIGARTSASQSHRQLASSLPFPVGFKNSIHGQIDVAIDGALSAQAPHTHVGIDEEGKIGKITTQGNPFTHIILRGSTSETNFTSEYISQIEETLREEQITLLIDCSHGNCGRKAELQKISFESALTQMAQGNSIIRGLLLESHLHSGSQPLPKNPSTLAYGVSITDPCLSWEETAELLIWGDQLLESSISSVQKW